MIVSFDSNILIYAADEDAGSRHHRAADLIERAIRHRLGMLTLQALSEFFNIVTRKIKIETSAAMTFVEGWVAVFPVQSATEVDLAEAMRVVRDHGLQFWDAMLWAAARRAGVRFLLSEDFQDGRILEGVTFINPFTPANARLIDHHLPAATTD